MDPRVHEGLRLVVALGQPAQASQAERLLALLASSADPASEDAARDLVDAYLHDPYLTR